MHNQADPDKSPYELRDLNIKIILATFVVTVVLMVIAMIAMRGMDLDWQAGGLSNSPMALDRPEPTEAARRSAPPEMPPGPQLQDAPEKDLAAHLEEQESARDSYGWVNEEAGIAHIPVSVAKEHVLQHGIPDWSHLMPTEEGGQ